MEVMGVMSPTSVLRGGSGCSGLLRELEQIWNDIGESQFEKDRMYMELERECLEVYRRKVDEAAKEKAHLHQNVAAKEAELATLMAALGELNIHLMSQTEKKSASLKEKLAAITPLVEDFQMKKDEREKQFVNIKAQIEKISGEIAGYNHINTGSASSLTFEEHDFSLRKLTEYQTLLRAVQKEKSDRVNKVLGYVNEVHSLCAICGLDFGNTVRDVHPSLQGTNQEQITNIGDSTLEGLEQAILKLKTERKTRFNKLKDIFESLVELWNLMDSPRVDRRDFIRITSVVSLPESEITEPGVLSTDIIEQLSTEVDRLTKLKASRMKELVVRKRSELEEVCRVIHIEPDTSTAAEKIIALIDSGLVDPSELLANIEMQITKAKEEAESRKEIMDRIARWLSACEEESWLEGYNLDASRYSSGRGGHINLQCAERARIAVSKIPAMVDNLIKKTRIWENEKNAPFLYDGARLLSILEDYKLTRYEKEEEKKKLRDQKKLQDLLLKEKEARYGSKPAPKRSNSLRKPSGHANGSMTPMPPMTPMSRRNSLSRSTCATPDLTTPRSYSSRQYGYSREGRRLSFASSNFVSMSKEDTMSLAASVCGSELDSPPLGMIETHLIRLRRLK